MDILGALKELNQGSDMWKFGMLDWIYLINKIDDKKTVAICGSDTAVYLDLLYQSYRFFAVLSVLSIGMLVLYVTGYPSSEYEFYLREGQILALE